MRSKTEKRNPNETEIMQGEAENFPNVTITTLREVNMSAVKQGGGIKSIRQQKRTLRKCKYDSRNENFNEKAGK